MEVSEPRFPDAPMIQRLRVRENARPWPVAHNVHVPVPVELRKRLDAIKESHPFPEEEGYPLDPEEEWLDREAWRE